MKKNICYYSLTKPIVIIHQQKNNEWFSTLRWKGEGV